MTLYNDLISIGQSIGRGAEPPRDVVVRSIYECAKLLAGPPITVGGSFTINAENADGYNGRILNFSTAATITIAAGCPLGFGFAYSPPASGDASIAFSGTTGNGSNSTITRAAASNTLCAVQGTATADAYLVTGS